MRLINRLMSVRFPKFERTRRRGVRGSLEAGRARLTVEVAVDYALSEPVIPAAQSAQAVKEEFSGLTRRERGVLSADRSRQIQSEIARDDRRRENHRNVCDAHSR